MERKALRTCAGCGNTEYKLPKCCRSTVAPKCKIGYNWSLLKTNCFAYVPRFEKKAEAKKQIEVELL